MENDKQPWIDITNIRPAEDIVFYSDGAKLSLNIDLVNIGKSPALAVDPWISPYLDGLGFFGAFKKPDFRPLDQGKSILFPTTPVQRNVTGFVPAEQVNRALRREDRIFPVAIPLCVDYRASDPHKTCYVMLLVDNEGKMIKLTDPPKTIPKESLKLTYRPFSAVAY